MTLVLAHGAGSNRNAAILVAVEAALAAPGLLIERIDLAFREEGRKGPPRPADAWRDRESIRRATMALRGRAPGPHLIGGHSYGGRQASMLAAEDPQVADGLLLLSYPLHPPAKPQQLRTAHFPELRMPALFVSGTRDEFGTPDELESAVRLIPARTRLTLVESVGHDLKPKKSAEPIAAAFREFFA